MLEFYQNIPQHLNPIAFSVGFLNIRWYSLSYLIGLAIVVGILKWRVSKKETNLKWKDIFDFLIYSFGGILAGGRVGYILFYNLNYYFKHPIEIISPLNTGGEFVGLYGMSYHGAIIGFAIVVYFFTKKRKINFWKMSDFIAPAISIGYFFGRMGNFLNGELYGRITEKRWGMFFNGEKYLRHPSQLYEAFGEGIILFVILWTLRNRFSQKTGILSGLYLMGYGVIRFCLEFFRQPDLQVGFIFGFLTMGQILSLLMFLVGSVIIIIAWLKPRRKLF